MSDAEWLAGLKPGDTVAVERGGFSETVYSIAKVVRRTPTGRISVASPDLGEGAVQFDKHGRHRIESWASWHIEPVTEKIRAKIERADLVAKLSRQVWSTMKLAHLRAAWSALKAAQKALPVAQEPRSCCGGCGGSGCGSDAQAGAQGAQEGSK